MTESELTAKTPRELFGPEGVLLENKGVEKVLRVAMDIDYIRQRVAEKGLNVLDMWTDSDMGTFFVVYRDGQTLGESLPITEDNIKGFIWVADKEFERFQDLIGVDERIVAESIE